MGTRSGHSDVKIILKYSYFTWITYLVLKVSPDLLLSLNVFPGMWRQMRGATQGLSEMVEGWEGEWGVVERKMLTWAGLWGCGDPHPCPMWGHAEHSWV